MSHGIHNIFVGLQGLAMGLYQISRLFYCFSSSKVHSNKGYPNWVFILMYGVGIGLVFGFLKLTFLDMTFSPLSTCGFNKNNK